MEDNDVFEITLEEQRDDYRAMKEKVREEYEEFKEKRQHTQADARERRYEDDNGAPRDIPADDYVFKVGGAKVRISHAAFPYPIIVSGVYLILGFLFGWWHPAWLLFLTIPLYYTMPDLEHESLRHALLKFCYPVVVTLAYLAIGFTFGWWHPWWMLYLTIPLYYIFAANIDESR